MRRVRATPAMPMPLIGEAIVDGDVRAVAVVVHVGRVDAADGSSHGPSISSPFASAGMSVVKLRLSCVVEVRRDVGVRAVDAGVDDPDEHAACSRVRRGTSRRSVASICCMSHWRSASGSAFGPLPGWDRRCSVSAFASFCVSASRSGLLDRIAVDGAFPAGTLPMIVFSATPSTPLRQRSPRTKRRSNARSRHRLRRSP